MSPDKEPDLVEIFAGTAWQTGVVKSLLEDAGVESFLRDAIMGTLSPWWTAPGAAGSVKIFVSFKDFEDAKIIVEEYEKNLKDRE